MVEASPDASHPYRYVPPVRRSRSRIGPRGHRCDEPDDVGRNDCPRAACMIPRIGREIDSEQYWRERAGQYSGEIADAYHQHRLSVIEALYPSGGVTGLHCLEFGSGDGVVLSRLAASGADVTGIER